MGGLHALIAVAWTALCAAATWYARARTKCR